MQSESHNTLHDTKILQQRDQHAHCFMQLFKGKGMHIYSTPTTKQKLKKEKSYTIKFYTFLWGSGAWGTPGGAWGLLMVLHSEAFRDHMGRCDQTRSARCMANAIPHSSTALAP